MKTLQNDRWLANPVVLCSLFTFFVSFCLANYLSILPAEWNLLQDVAPDISPTINKTMLLVLTGAIAMWIGYWSQLAERFSQRLQCSQFLARILRPDIDPHTYVLVFCVVASLISRFISIRLGVFGYSSDIVRLAETASIKQYLTLTEALGTFGLILVSLRYFSPGGVTRQTRLWMLGLLVYEVTVGFMSGFKSQVVMPFIIIGVCRYLRTAVIPWRFIALAPVALFAAYLVIEPFRYARYESASFDYKSVGSIADTMIRSIKSEDTAISVTSDDAKLLIGLAVLRNFSLTEIASLGVEYADSGSLGEGAPAFLKSIFLAPLYAVVPRFLWGSKETTHHGQWYVAEIMGHPELETQAVAMSPFTYLYLAGGGLAVAIGFFFVGIIQRILVNNFLYNKANGAIVVFIILLLPVVMINSIFFAFIIQLIRLIPIALVIQYYSLKASPRTAD